MVTVSLGELDLFEEWGRDDPTLRLRADFPVFGGHGASDSAVVVFELGEGEHVGLHTDSAEEVVLVLDGRAEATLDGDTGVVGEREMVVIPAGVPHDVRNVGTGVMRAVGFFASGEVESVFAETLEPSGERAFRVPPPAEAE